jgi:phage terminase large subunit GpA-like protein
MQPQTDFGNPRGVAAAIRSAQAMLRPPPDLRPHEWAEHNVKVPVGNAVPGLIRFDNAPYQREPLDMTADPTCQRITLQWGAQVGKTMLALCAQAYRIGQNPVSQIMMQPSQGDLHTWLETKFNPLVEANETLQDLIAKPRGREGVNNQRMKSYPGGFLMFSWSGSPKTMRGRSAPFIVCDETDGYDRTQEGHPVGLLWQRAATFGDQRLLLEISTPTIKGGSWIESAFEQGDQRRFHVPCPHCGERQALRWANVTWDKDDEGNHLPDTARYICAAEGCGTLWTDGERIAAIRKGEWVASRPFRGHASYHLSELYSCFRRLADIVQSFLDKKAANDLQTFVNVSLAETWEEQGERADPSGLMARAERFAAPVPGGGLVLTAGIDMQQDRLEVETVAWGLGEESWSVDYTTLWGDPLHGDVWADLDDYLAQTFMHQSGAQLSISAACMDTGGTAGYTQAAYEYARTRTGRRLFAIKGVGGWGRPIVSAPSRKASGQRARKVDLFTVGVDEAKLIVQRRLGVTVPGPGFCHFPADRGAEWFEGLTAEQLITKYVRGFPTREWHKRRDRNEPFDCRVYAFAALKILNPNLPRAAKRLAMPDEPEPAPPPVETLALPERISVKENPPEERAEPDGDTDGKRKFRKRARRRGDGWVNKWG